MNKLFSICLFLVGFQLSAQNYPTQIGVLKYNGGGDWYANLETSLPNLIEFCNKNLQTTINKEQVVVEVGSREIFNYPFLHMTGHGNVIFSSEEAENLRNYLLGGGFLHIDDNYGMDQFLRKELTKVFPDKQLIEVPFDHPIYHQKYNFNSGVPKIHEHDKKPAQGFGIFHDDRLMLFYTYEADLGDGWEDPEIHNDSENTRLRALQMGANIISYAFANL